MTHHEIPVSDAEHDVFERVRREQGLSSVAEAVTWLVKSHLRKSTEQTTGRRRGPRLATSKLSLIHI